jgi:glycosyltransferase involved in cell wall biosynthesis
VKRVRVLHIYKDYPPVLGGIEHHLHDLAEGLAARRHSVTVLVTSPDRLTTIEVPGPHLTIIRAARNFHLASTPLSFDMLRRAFRLEADIVHLQFPYPPGDLAGWLVPHSPRLVISYQSDIVRQQNLLRIYRPLLEQTLARADRILVSSPAYAQTSPWLQDHQERCRVVPLGVEPARFTHANQEPAQQLRRQLGGGPLLLFVGRLRYYKGLHILVDALPSIPHATLVIAGTGPEQGRLETQATRLGVANRVRFLGDVPEAELPALHRACDLFVLPSHLRAEAFGIAQAEAMASGLPCVSTELGTGTSYVNKHSQTGIVVPPDSPAALARAINALLASPELRRHYGANARRRIEQHFSVAAMLDRVEEVYQEILVG